MININTNIMGTVTISGWKSVISNLINRAVKDAEADFKTSLVTSRLVDSAKHLREMYKLQRDIESGKPIAQGDMHFLAIFASEEHFPVIVELVTLDATAFIFV